MAEILICDRCFCDDYDDLVVITKNNLCPNCEEYVIGIDLEEAKEIIQDKINELDSEIQDHGNTIEELEEQKDEFEIIIDNIEEFFDKRKEIII